MVECSPSAADLRAAHARCARAAVTTIQTEGPSDVDVGVGVVAVLGSLALAWWWRSRADRRPALALLAWTWIWFVPIGQLLIPVHGEGWMSQDVVGVFGSTVLTTTRRQTT